MLWAEDMAQVAECLSNKLKNLSSNHSTAPSQER
jgi:hypothetical protein